MDLISIKRQLELIRIESTNSIHIDIKNDDDSDTINTKENHNKNK